jgi:hypothetical protein
MFGLALVLFAVTIAFTADYAWAALRDWRSRRLAVKTGPTLTRKFTFPQM